MNFQIGLELSTKNKEHTYSLTKKKSEYFKIERGTRQGCPLSPLLFVMILEVLNNDIRENKEIKGVTVKDQLYKLKAFADDIIYFLEEPMDSIVHLKTSLENYGEVSSFKINHNKTVMITKNLDQREDIRLSEKSGFKIQNKARYLGIQITKRNIDLWRNNYKTTWEEVKKDLIKWSKLHISFSGRIVIIKMNILPKLMYLFQNLPIISEEKIFDKWQKDLTNFIWEGKRARIKWKLLTEDKEKGGLALPNLKLYYFASCLQWIEDWAKLENMIIDSRR